MDTTILSETQINNNALGATVHEKGVFFKLWAPNAKSIFLIGSFNNWKAYDISMIPEEGIIFPKM